VRYRKADHFNAARWLMRHLFRATACSVFFAAWASSVVIGGVMLFRYESTAGSAGHPATTLPTTRFVPKAGEFRLVMAIHPQCPCSRATIEELARLMAACDGKLQARVLMVRPSDEPEGWERSDLWTSAQRIPGVEVCVDEDAVEAERFGADTSGHTLLYSAEGRLLFSGGITESRGHGGDNDGESAIISFVLGKPPTDVSKPITTPVYGCSLMHRSILKTEGPAWLK
jgi:hypothetical protein